MVLRLPGKHRPEPVDVFGQAVVGIGDEFPGRHLVKAEVLVDEGAEIEARLIAAGAVGLEYGFGIASRRAVDEGLAVGKHPLHLHGDEQLLIAIGGAEGIGQRNGADVMAERLVRLATGHCSL